MIKSIFGFLRLVKETKKTITDAERERENIKKTTEALVNTLNGEDRWFLRLCDNKKDDCTLDKGGE